MASCNFFLVRPIAVLMAGVSSTCALRQASASGLSFSSSQSIADERQYNSLQNVFTIFTVISAIAHLLVLLTYRWTCAAHRKFCMLTLLEIFHDLVCLRTHPNPL